MAITVTYNKVRELEEGEKEALTSIVQKELVKIERLVKEEGNLIVNIKVRKKESRKRYELTLKLETPKKVYTVRNKDTERGGDWDISKSAHEAMDALIAELKHFLKSDESSFKKGFFNKIFGD
jgi:ribosome-associated translation inhibitor RaiA